MNYKRVFMENVYVHLIIVSYNRKNIFVDNIDIVRTAFKNVKKIYSFDIVAICVLPDHIHVILHPKDIKQYPQIISSIKHYVSKNIDVGQVCPTYGYRNKREKGVFQRRYYEHTIKSEEELNNHIDYIHYNPMKHLNIPPKDWKYSSFHKFVKNNLLDKNWGDANDIKNIIDMNYE